MNEINSMRASQRSSPWIGAGGAACLTVLIVGALVPGDGTEGQQPGPTASHLAPPGPGPTPSAAMGVLSGSPEPANPQHPADDPSVPAEPKTTPPDMAPHDGFFIGPDGGCPACGRGFVDARQRSFLNHLTQLG